VRLGLLVTAAGFGLRHGVDWDHIAAITDLAGSQTSRRRSIVLATLYILGHGAVVLVLGVAAIALSERLPTSVDTAMERVVGATLVALGVYVLVGLLREGREFRLRSRWMLVIAAVRGARRRVAARSGASADGAVEPEPVTAPDALDEPFFGSDARTALGVGVIHGIGAETPTLVLVFVAAAGAGGTGVGVAMLLAFVVGLIASNTAIALAATFGYLGASKSFPVYAAVSIVAGVFSLVIGTVFLLGAGGVLPAFFNS
jgi:cytochrome c biogenesis protein CcdA